MNLSIKDIYVKHTLGKIFFFLLSLSLLHSEDFTYVITPSKQVVYLHEPLLLTVDFNQTNPDIVLLFHFAIEKNRSYEVKPLFAQHDNSLHHAKHHNTYVIYPLQTGDVNITFSLTKRVTNDEKVRYFSSGDRDDFKKLETNDFPIALPPVTLHVKPLPSGTQIVGEYTLDYHIDSHEAKAYTPLSMQVTLKGKGYPPRLPNLVPKSPAYELFSEKPEIKTFSSQKGFMTTAKYVFAFSADKSFTLPAITLHAFNPQTEKSYILTIPKQDFKVDAVDKHTLVDTVDAPPPLHSDFSWVKNLLVYCLIFAAGYFSAMIIKWQRKSTRKTSHPLVEKIQNTKDTKALLQVLMAQDSPRFTSCIEHLEKALYDDGKINLSKVKEEAIDLI